MIPFLDLKAINKPYEKAFQDQLKKVMDNGWYILGDELKTFETNFSKYCNAKYCIGVGNGFDAIVLLFKGHIALGNLKKGDEVIVPANTYIASILAILEADLVPVLVEPDVATFNINPTLIPENITAKTRAILVVHMYGQLAEMEAIYSIAEQNNLLVLQDAAQSHGAIYDHKLSANFCQSVAYSFYPGKNLGALGDGGAITTNDAALADVLFSIRNYGSTIKYNHEHIGVNSRLDELQAAFLSKKLHDLDSANLGRIAIAKRYLSEIKNDKILLPKWDLIKPHVFHLFVIRTANRADLQHYLLKNGIQTMIHYPIAPHKQKALVAFEHLSLPITEKMHDEVLSLPIAPVLTMEEVDYIIATLNAY